MDTGAPISYQVLEPGTPVYSSDGQRIGSVVHVLAVAEEDVFDGIVIDEHSGEPHLGHGEHRFVDADEVASLHERAVTLALTAAACRDLPRPSANPGVMRDDPADPGGGQLASKLRRAWDLISGNY
ncbi:MAG: DUF2171 domain-containing protein [Solirubrobacterales bacterium]|nr:DUF2171 domain-containing protein [Solirubrobacterales bacterium]MBV9472163.1 DUF2171 domain-containing protein [Solirubrobacterales bacterium]MBV9839621.1 DUF2171 domain-containing protein [Solirubrobacterales bacterium]